MRFFTTIFIFIIFLATSVLGPVGAGTAYRIPEVTGGQVDEALVRIVPIRLLPSNPFYFAIFAKEAVGGFFKPSALKKADWDFVLCGKRLKEAYLLFEKNDLKNSSKAFGRYARVSEKTVDQLNKARSQNQDVATLEAKVEEQLWYQLILFSAIEKKRGSTSQSYNFGSNFSKAFDGFSRIVEATNQIKPGTRDKFFPKTN